MKLRLLTILAVALVAFYAGAKVDSIRSADEPASIPKALSIPITTIPAGESVTVHTFTIESHTDPVLTAAAIGAIPAALFLLARFAVIVVRRTRASRRPA